jgi:hypothetical protein
MPVSLTKKWSHSEIDNRVFRTTFSQNVALLRGRLNNSHLKQVLVYFRLLHKYLKSNPALFQTGAADELAVSKR